MHSKKSPPKKSKTWPRIILIAIILIYITYFSLYQIARYRALWTFIDLAAVEQTIWNTLHGRFMHYTIYPTVHKSIDVFTDRVTENRLGTHVQPILLLLALPYMLIPRPETLLVTMCITVGLGALPFYHIVKRRLHSEKWSLLLTLAYLLLPAIQTANGWDLHGTSLLPTLLLFAFDAAERHNLLWWWVWALLAMGCREDLPFLVGWAMFFMVPKDLRRQAGYMLGLGFVFSCLNFFVIIPYFSGGSTPYLSFFVSSNSGDTTGGLLNSLTDIIFWGPKIINFLRYNFQLAIPLLGLYYLHWPTVLAIAPTLVINSLSHKMTTIAPSYSHYSLPLIPWVLIGTLEGQRIVNRHLMRLNSTLPWRATLSGGLCLTILATQFMEGYTPLNKNFVWPRPAQHYAAIKTLSGLIPPNAPASIGEHLATHNAQRHTLRIFPDLRDVDWVFINVWQGGYPYGMAPGTWEQLFSDPTWETVSARDGLILLKRGQGPPAHIAAAFIPPNNDTQLLNIQFGESAAKLYLHALHIVPQPLSNTFYVCSDWENVGNESLNIKLGFYDPADQGSQVLDATYIYPSLFHQPGKFRDCTLLFKNTRNSNISITFEVQTETQQSLPLLIIDPGAWQKQLSQHDHKLYVQLGE